MSFFRGLAPAVRIGSLSIRLSPAREPIVKSVRSFCSPQPIIYEVKDFEEFQEKISKVSYTTPVIIDCYADWCGPCKNLTPKLEEKVRNQNGSVLLAKINVDLAGELAVDLGVSAVPTVIGVKNGEGIGSFQGDQPDEVLDSFIEQVIQGECPGDIE